MTAGPVAALLPGGRPGSPTRTPWTAGVRWLPPLLILAALAAIAAFAVGEALVAGGTRLPGRDATNLYVWEVYTRSVLADGELPHWNPYQFGGTPHLADVQTTIFYPPAMLLRWLPPVLFLGWMAALHLWLAGAGALFLCRVLGVGWVAAGAAAIAVTLGGSMGGWLYNGHLLLIYGTAWLPWAVALSILSVRRGTVTPHPALVVVLALQFLAGYLQGSLYITGAVCAYYAFSVLWPDAGIRGAARLRVLVQFACLGALALGISAFQLVPTLRLVTEAGRTAGLSFDVASAEGWTLADAATVFFPFGFLVDQPPHRYLSDRVVYVGWALAWVAPLAFVPSRLRRAAVFFGLLSAGAVVLALAESLPFYAVHYALFPGLRMPGRVLFLANLGVAVLGAMGLERFVHAARTGAWREIAGCGAIAAAAVAAAATAVWPREAGAGLAPLHLWPYVPVLAAGGLLAAAVLAARSAVQAALVAVLVVAAVDLGAYSRDAMETVPAAGEEGPLPAQSPGFGRAISVCEDQFGTADLLLQRQPTLDGMASLHLDDYADWAYIAKTGDIPPDDGQFRRIGSDEGLFPARRDLLDTANTTGVLACAPLRAADLILLASAGPVSLYRNVAAWPRATWICDSEQLPREEVVRRLVGGRYDAHRRLRPRATVGVRWVEGLSDEGRQSRERRYGLIHGVRREGTTWQYTYPNETPSNGIALVQDPAVEDTAGIDRGTGAVLEAPTARVAGPAADPGELLVESAACAGQGHVRVLAADRPDGTVRVRVDAPAAGLVFFSEPYYGERMAIVDGRPAAAMRANLAFTAVPVPAGRHEIELRLEPRSFHAGVGLSLFTLAAWIGTGLSTRRTRSQASRRREPAGL